MGKHLMGFFMKLKSLPEFFIKFDLVPSQRANTYYAHEFWGEQQRQVKEILQREGKIPLKQIQERRILREDQRAQRVTLYKITPLSAYGDSEKVNDHYLPVGGKTVLKMMRLRTFHFFLRRP